MVERVLPIREVTLRNSFDEAWQTDYDPPRKRIAFEFAKFRIDEVARLSNDRPAFRDQPKLFV